MSASARAAAIARLFRTASGAAAEPSLGRKRRIDQSNCNKDFPPHRGLLPEFVTVHGGKLRKAGRTAADPSALFDLPVPATPADGLAHLAPGSAANGVARIGACRHGSACRRP
jgi:indolepyruvate ferredoxin oxidoreductase